MMHPQRRSEVPAQRRSEKARVDEVRAAAFEGEIGEEKAETGEVWLGKRPS